MTDDPTTPDAIPSIAPDTTPADAPGDDIDRLADAADDGGAEDQPTTEVPK